MRPVFWITLALAVVLSSPARAQEEKQLTAERLCERGNLFLSKGDADAAIKDYDDAIRLRPAYEDAFKNRGNARHLKGDLDGALSDYEKAIQLRPSDANAFYNRANVSREQGNLDIALKDYDEAIRLKRSFADAFNNRGLVRLAKGDFNGAITDFSEAILLMPKMAEAFNNRGLVRLKKVEFDLAVPDFEQAIRLNPNYQEAIKNLAIARGTGTSGNPTTVTASPRRPNRNVLELERKQELIGTKQAEGILTSQSYREKVRAYCQGYAEGVHYQWSSSLASPKELETRYQRLLATGPRTQAENVQRSRTLDGLRELIDGYNGNLVGCISAFQHGRAALPTTDKLNRQLQGSRLRVAEIDRLLKSPGKEVVPGNDSVEPKDHLCPHPAVSPFCSYFSLTWHSPASSFCSCAQSAAIVTANSMGRFLSLRFVLNRRRYIADAIRAAQLRVQVCPESGRDPFSGEFPEIDGLSDHAALVHRLLSLRMT